jgi:rod shape-determining protein MreC
MKKFSLKRPNIWIAGIVLLIILSLFGLFGFFENIIVAISSPMQSGYQAVSRGINSIYQISFGRENVLTRLNDLEGEVENLAVDYVEFNALKEENELLKKQINYLETVDYKSISAKILTYINSPNEKILIINKGTADGIDVGYPVIGGEGLMIGRVSLARDYISEVELITDPYSKIPVKILGMDKTIGIASGSYGSILKMELIPIQEDIKVNDMVVTSSLEENIPPNLIVGLINEINISGNEPFKTALVEPLANFYSLSIITVIIPSNV